MRGWGRRRRRAARRRRIGQVAGWLGLAALAGLGYLAVVHLPEWETDAERPARTLDAAEDGEGVAEEGMAPSGERIRVEVLNAGGVAGMARRVRGELRDRGFDVVYYGNASAFGREETVVLDRVGRSRPAELVARALGADEVRSEVDSARLVEVTVLLGSEWEPFGDGEGADGSVAGDAREEVDGDEAGEGWLEWLPFR